MLVTRKRTETGFREGKQKIEVESFRLKVVWLIFEGSCEWEAR
jgi:hypothetical protein